LDGSGRVQRLFPNYREVEQEYYQRTGFFPIMHLVVVRRALYQEHTWVAASLLRAFVQAQRIGWERLQRIDSLQVLLPWLPAEIEATTALMGLNHWKQGFAENYDILDSMCQYHREQGLSKRRLSAEELFATETHEVSLEL
ncbi:MAG: ABC transporter substrate-binding protein, partial [Candidatus Binatia bacterium]